MTGSSFQTEFPFYASASFCLCPCCVAWFFFSFFYRLGQSSTFLKTPQNCYTERESMHQNKKKTKKTTWDGAQQHVVFNAAVNVVVALRFEGRPRRQDGVERVEIVCFHCSENENAQHWHTENTIHTYKSHFSSRSAGGCQCFIYFVSCLFTY